jgi:hypothetical protein
MESNNRGVLFINDKKDHETKPHYKGSIVVDGVEYWLSGWVNLSQENTKYMSLTVNKKEKITAEDVHVLF